MPEETQQALLPLDAPRVIVLRGKDDHAFTYRFRRITMDDWQKYFGGIVHQTINHGEEREQIYEAEAALLALIDRVLDKVEGYTVQPLADWRKALPLSHRRAAGLVLRSAGTSDASNDSVLAELLEVRLDATWSADEQGKMQMFTGLVHRFRQPTIEQLKRFNCESARVRVSGSAESGVTTYPIRQAIAMKMYDELIDSVEGYSVNGQPLTDVETIQREMDGAHKAMAALAVFAGDGDVTIA